MEFWYHGTKNKQAILQNGFNIENSRMGVLGKAIYLGERSEAEKYGEVLKVRIGDLENAMIIDARHDSEKLGMICYSDPLVNVENGIRCAILKNRPDGTDMVAVYDPSIIVGIFLDE